MQAFASFKQFVHTLVLAQLQQDVHILTVFEKVLEETDISMLDCSVDLDLTHKLLFGPTPGKTLLGNNLGSMDVLGLRIYEFITLSKTTLAEIFAFDIPLYTLFTI